MATTGTLAIIAPVILPGSCANKVRVEETDMSGKRSASWQACRSVALLSMHAHLVWTKHIRLHAPQIQEYCNLQQGRQSGEENANLNEQGVRKPDENETYESAACGREDVQD